MGLTGPYPYTYEQRVCAFWDKVAVTDGCWLFQGCLQSQGYGHFGIGGPRHQLAHRFAYELVVGAIPEGLDIDHLCHNADESCPGGPTCLHRRCVNPAHLVPASRLENARRGRAYRPSHCVHGHLYDEANTYLTPDGHLRCRKCKLVHGTRYRRSKGIPARYPEDFQARGER